MPSYAVPSVLRYQLVTISTPSGLSDGTRMQDRVLQDRAEARLVFGEQAVGELDGAVRRGDFGGVDGAGHQDDVLAFARSAARLRAGVVMRGSARRRWMSR